ESSDSGSSDTESSDTESSEIEASDLEATETETESTQVLSTEDSTSEEAIADAINAFQNILQEKQLMALLYHTESYEVQQVAGSYDHPAATIKSGHTLYIENLEILDGEVWYQVRFWLDGKEQTGYVEASYLAYADEDWIAWEKEYLRTLFPKSTAYGITAYRDATGHADYSDINAFPSIYQSSLRALKDQHPTWTFVPMYTGLDFNTAVSNETGAKNLIQNTASNASKGWVGSPCPTESGWYYATKPAVTYYMNPCNFLTETSIFQFEQLTFNSSYHNVSAIQTFLNNTFMKGKIPGDSRTYAQAFYEIGKSRRLSPIHLASRVYQEQGSGNSALISGTYKGFEGYYNYFNVGVNGASTAEKIQKGLTYAKQKGWNTRYKSLDGGAATIGNNYILKGQDTVYLQKFNVDVNSPHGLYNHQYMQNVQAPASEASSIKRMYAGTGSLDSGFVFKIPVYQNMPGEKAIKSISLDKTSLHLYRSDAVENLPSSGFSATATLSVKIEPADTTDDKTITWTSSNSKIVSVKPDKSTHKAVVTALDGGEATITAQSQNGKTAKCKVKVEAPLYSFQLKNLNAETDTSAATLYTGQNLTLTADYQPKDTTDEVQITWASTNPSVASVQGGKVTAHAPGSTTITAALGRFSASYDIHVQECSVTFMSTDYTQILHKIQTAVGSTIPIESFPTIESTADKLFIGWFTGKNGQGTRFDEHTRINQNEIVLYPYFEQQGKGFYVIPVGDQTYTGSSIKPQVQVYDSVTYNDGNTELIELVQGQDYTVSYKNNKNVNTSAKKMPTITVKGKGNYTGTESVTFNILPKSLTDHDITADNLTVAYNGKVQKTSPAVYRDGKKLTKTTDYTLSYPYMKAGAYKKAGVYPIVIKGTKNYTGTRTVNVTISQKTMLSKVSVSKIPNQTYKNELVTNGSGIIPEQLHVTYKNKLLVQSTDGGKTGDYTVTYKNNRTIGTATATITAVEGSAYAGSKNITYKIVGQKLSKAAVNGITAKTYTGNESDVLQHNVQLTLDNKVLRESKDHGVTGDYVVSYKNTAKAGTATIIFKGINEYSGELKKTYKITAQEISNGNNALHEGITMTYTTEEAASKPIVITDLSQITSPYMKGGAKPQISLYYNGMTLIPGRDYTVSYKNNTAVTSANLPEHRLPKLTIKGKGSFKGTLTGTWRITDGAMSDTNEKLTISAKDITYKKKANSYKTTLTITDANGKKLSAGKDYDKHVIYTYVNDTLVSTADAAQITRKAGDVVDKNDIINANTRIRVTVKGIGAYAGSGNATLSTTYRIIAANINSAKLKISAKVYQNGREVTLTPEDIKLTLNGTELIHGTDYLIDENSYTNNTKKGKASVILRGIGANYGGQRKITFTITSKSLLWWWRN
ncbi:MAG: Ig-like domain-containing protein, partial [Lachnospiraceae bacterium]|nr:Ig-like domain-containing protein [Lachnospiraceae bacterium]